MDSITHVALGATVGELFFEKGFGKKALFWGALAQSIPDIDFLAFLWMSTPEAMIAHRGFTHSFLGAALFIAFFSLIADAVHRPHNIRFVRWVFFFSVEIMLHLLLDVLNSYGIGWMEPFSHQRFSLNILYVADPFFSLPFIVAFLMLLFFNSYWPGRIKIARTAILIGLLYLTFAFYHKNKINQLVERQLRVQNIAYTDYLTTPTPLQNWLWWIVVKDRRGYNCGYYSFFDQSSHIIFSRFSNNDSIELNFHQDPVFQGLKRFSQGYYWMSFCGDTAVFNDLRFGQVFGWRDANNPFVMHYHLKDNRSNKLVIQQGRLVGWNLKQLRIYMKRVLGYQVSRLK